MPKPPFHSSELSWMDFNERVLETAHREEYPVLERLKFLAISASNLDEFFMVRVAYLHDRCRDGKKAASPDDAGHTPREQLHMVLERAADFRSRQAQCLVRLREELAAADAALLAWHQLDGAQQASVEQRYLEHILPVLTPLAVDPARPFPFLLNKALYIGVRLRDEAGKNCYGLVQVPANLPRLLSLPSGRGEAFLLLEEVIANHLTALFGQHRIKAYGVFRVTRSADFDADEDTDDLLEEMKRTIKKRKRGKPIRLELEERPNKKGELRFDEKLGRFLIGMLKIRRRYVFSGPGPLDLASLGKLAGARTLSQLRPEPQEPVEAADFRGCADIFSAIRTRDRMLHLPFERFEHVVDFISAAAQDPEVLAIKQTLYRVSGDSRVISALERAAELGKQVTVLIELRARFDEESNIQWAERLERAGCHVIYGLTGLKTHSKITLVVRREGEGVTRYVHLSTGNYNDATARSYTDICLFTCQPAIGADASDLFNHLTGFAEAPKYRKLVAAPEGMRPFLRERIGREVENARQGKPCGITCKVNSLLDGEIVRSLYTASGEGVPVRLLVRGICSLVPQVSGVSENIRVRSLVGRYLEHSRIFSFENGGDPLLYLSSADLMPRNLDRRVELLFPVEEPVLKKRLITTLELLWRDNADAWEQGEDGRYRPAERKGRKLCAQQELARMAQRGWRQRGGPRGTKPDRQAKSGEEKQGEDRNADQRRGLPGTERGPARRGQDPIQGQGN